MSNGSPVFQHHDVRRGEAGQRSVILVGGDQREPHFAHTLANQGSRLAAEVGDDQNHSQ